MYRSRREKHYIQMPNLYKNLREMYVLSYITFIWLRMTESIAKALTLSSYTFKYSYDSTYKYVLMPAYLLGYLI